MRATNAQPDLRVQQEVLVWMVDPASKVNQAAQEKTTLQPVIAMCPDNQPASCQPVKDHQVHPDQEDPLDRKEDPVRQELQEKEADPVPLARPVQPAPLEEMENPVPKGRLETTRLAVEERKAPRDHPVQLVHPDRKARPEHRQLVAEESVLPDQPDLLAQEDRTAPPENLAEPVHPETPVRTPSTVLAHQETAWPLADPSLRAIKHAITKIDERNLVSFLYCIFVASLPM